MKTDPRTERQQARTVMRQMSPAPAGLVGVDASPALKLVAAAGGDYEIGRAMGRALSTEIGTIWNGWALKHMDSWFGTRPEEHTATAEWLDTNLQCIAPWMSEQIRGLAAGSGLPVEQLMLMNHYAVLWSACGLFCSSLALRETDSGSALIQNLDVGTEDLYFVARLSPEKGYATLSDGMHAMCWSPTGVNEKGLVVGSSNLSAPAVKVDKPLTSGVPSTFIPRMVLRACADTPEAVEFIRSLPPVVPLNSGYQLNLIDAAGRMAVIDKTGERVLVRQCQPGANYTTNVSLDSELEEWRLGDQPRENSALHGRHRAERIRASVETLGGQPASIQWMKELFRSHDGDGRLCRHGPKCAGSYSRLSLVYRCDARSLEITNGPPCRHHYQQFRFDGGRYGGFQAQGATGHA